VWGIVQGVGFRPFVYKLAVDLELHGIVRNDSSGVTIEVEGTPASLRLFKHFLVEQAPPRARIQDVVVERVPKRGDTEFLIAPSQPGSERSAPITSDTASCVDCLAELFNPADRRYHYPFTNCTNCGPRFTIVEDVPYDRANTTMKSFVMCSACQAEYEDPLNRRFHAQPNACAACGPHVHLLDNTGQDVEAYDSVAAAAEQLAKGAILAVKGLGGYHLACDALNETAVARLRSRKHRDAKPFALMVPDLETARELCLINEAEAALLGSPSRPIGLLKRRDDCRVPEGIAPGVRTLGIMLPYTPLHSLLLNAFSLYAGKDRHSVLVMTSGNLSDEPIAYRDDEVVERLAPIADGILTHDRPIYMRCDDSVVRIAAGNEQIFRRSRGYAPEPLQLPVESPLLPLLACGGHLKNTFCLVKGRHAFLSHHIGDLENLETLASFQEGIAHYSRLFDIHPQALAYDLHPEYLATKWALDSDIEQKVGVQHHHAHIGSVLAEHGLTGPVIGVAADGTGYGTDGAIWGGEIMLADLHSFRRLVHLSYVPLVGGEMAVKQPWRMAAVYLRQAYGDTFLDLDIPFVRLIDTKRWRSLAQMAERGLNSPPTSSLGRLFDAVSALLCVRSEALYEGQAAIELEMRAEPADGIYPFTAHAGSPTTLDVSPLIRAIVDDLLRGVPVPLIAWRFHCSIAEMLAASCLQERESTGVGIVALSGGVFQNKLLLEKLVARLEDLNFKVYLNRLVPTNDGGLSFGQAAVATAQLGLYGRKEL
jgi:hydrogenase maturation protein HypF